MTHTQVRVRRVTLATRVRRVTLVPLAGVTPESRRPARREREPVRHVRHPERQGPLQ